jgi:hypothetical protein
LEPSYAFQTFASGWKKNDSRDFLCAHCVYKVLSPELKAVYVFGGKQGLFFREVTLDNMDKTPQECLAVVDPKKFNSMKCYSSRWY